MTGRLRKQLLDKGAVDAVFEGLRLFVSFNQPKFEQCVQFGCRALIGLIMTGLVPSKPCIACALCVVEVCGGRIQTSLIQKHVIFVVGFWYLSYCRCLHASFPTSYSSGFLFSKLL